MHKSDLADMCQACVNTYEGKHGECNYINFGNWKFKEVNNVQFYTAKFKNDDLIVFRGSDDSEDWKYNLNCMKINARKVTPYREVNPKIKVHLGFISNYKQVRLLVLNYAKNKKTIYITGHSLGGAMAILCAVDLQYNYPDKSIICIPIASPKVGNSDFVNSYNRRVPETYSIVYRNDIVCKMPPFFFGYKSVQKKIIISKWYNPISMAIGVPWDHYPEKYLEAMKKYKGIV